MHLFRFWLAVLAAIAISSCATPSQQADTVTITVVGLNDIHGQLNASATNGGLVGISAYVNALRLARESDGGAVLVVDAGDMWQGTLESNLVEGVTLVEAYDELGVAAAAIGNHEFDFGPAGPKAIPIDPGDDPRGALRARAREAGFPLLAANLVDEETGLPVSWTNVRPSHMVEVAGVRVGIVGVTTEYALATTIAANTTGLRVTPLAAAIEREARRLRADGAALVVVVAHSGGRCGETSDPRDTSSCDMRSEIVSVADKLEPGLVDHIFGGHEDYEIAHVFSGTSVTTNLKSAASFGRVDFRIDRLGGTRIERTVYPPQPNALPLPDAYEGHPLEPDDGVRAVAAKAADLAAELRERGVGVVLEEAFPLTRDMESALFNLVTEALLDSFDVDIAIHNVRGGLRAGLPAGELTFGAVYEMFPFDNIASVHDISGRDLRRVIAVQSLRDRPTGFAGMRAFVDCANGRMDVRLLRDDGSDIGDDDRVTILANDFLAMGGDDILVPATPEGGFELRYDGPRTRDVLVDWFQAHGGSLHPADWRTHDAPKWNLSARVTSDCRL